MNRALLAAAAALIIVIGGAMLVLRPSSNVGPQVTPTPIPTATTQPTPTSNLVPAELLHTWVGVPHDFPGRSNVQSLTMAFQFGQIAVNANYVYGQDSFNSEVSVVGPNTLEVRALSNGCDLRAIGHYTWSLSPGGTLLHLAKVDDACADRAVGFTGDWHAANCKDQTGVCWGDMEAGTYPTLFYGPRLDPSQEPVPVYGGLTFTVPNGWAVAGDFGTDVRLLRSSDYAKEPATGPVGPSTEIEAWIRPAANIQDGSCAATPAPGVVSTPDSLVSWIGFGLRDAVITGRAQQITIDGHAGRWIDVSVSPSWTQTCGFSEPTVPLITEAVGSAGPVGNDPYQVAISGQTRMRLIFLDVSQPELHANHTAMILITAPDQAAFDSFVNEAMPIVESFHFK